MKKTTHRILARTLAKTLRPLDAKQVRAVTGGMRIDEFVEQLLHNTATGPGGYSDASDA